jgi:hypothetical protein
VSVSRQERGVEMAISHKDIPSFAINFQLTTFDATFEICIQLHQDVRIWIKCPSPCVAAIHHTNEKSATLAGSLFTELTEAHLKKHPIKNMLKIT